MSGQAPQVVLNNLLAIAIQLTEDEVAYVNEMLDHDEYHKKDLNRIYDLEAKYLGG